MAKYHGRHYTTARAKCERWTSRGLALIDQGLSSLSNVAAVFLVARALDATDFGRFSLAYAVLILVLGLSRSYLGTRLSLAATVASARTFTAAVLGGLIVSSPVIALIVLAVGTVITGGASTNIVLVVAIAAPVVCLQDAVRFGAVACGRPGVAAISDSVWAAVVVGVLLSGEPLNGQVALVLWLGAAVAALVVGLTALQIMPKLRRGLQTLRQRHGIGESMAFGTAVGQATALAVSTVAAAVLGPAAAGALRGASTMMGPLNVIHAYVHLALTPALVRRERSRDVGYCVRAGGAIACVAALYAMAVLLIPDTVGELLLGQTWAGARTVLPFTSVEYLALGLATAAMLGLKVRGEAAVIVRQKAIVGLTTVVFGCGFALLFGDVRMVALGLAMAGVLSAALGWYHLVRGDGESGTPFASQALASSTP